MRSRIPIVLGAIALQGWMPADVIAVDWEKLVMPGPLVSVHEKWEDDCSACHKAFDTSAQRSLCLDCHKDVASDLASGEGEDRGFHGRNPLARSGECRSCHTDHEGREADISGLSEATFDHAETDLALRGAHQSVACDRCHRPDVRRRDAPTECVDCHRSDDAHDGKLSTDCGRCHGESDWRTTRFDHDKTNYPLEGAHASASCVGCHAGQRYKETPRECARCHSIDDAHAGRFGDRCGECHGSDSWRQEGFDHERKSGFALRGAHGRAACNSCHHQAPGKRELPKDCNGCHASEDVHAKRFGADCGDCHRSENWRDVAFDHGERTRFPLHGAHGETACTSCHSGPRDAKAGKGRRDHRCIACHRRDDVHRGKLGTDCAECHREDSFVDRIAFDHDLTKFPLLGLHAMAPCESCHENHTFQRAESGCESCHATDDVHERSLGSNCASCHNPNGWPVWRFDHDRRTTFSLEGAHERLECAACHRQPMTATTRTSKACVACHSSEDPHRGGFGRSCGECHSAKAWKPAKIGRARGDKS